MSTQEIPYMTNTIISFELYGMTRYVTQLDSQSIGYSSIREKACDIRPKNFNETFHLINKIGGHSIKTITG